MQGEGWCRGEFAQGEGAARSAASGLRPLKPPGGRLGLRPMLGFGRNKKRGSSRRDCPFDASIIQRQ